MDSFSEKLYSRFPMFQERGPDVSFFRQFLNLLGCIIIIPIYTVITAYTHHPLTLDILLMIFIAEYNRLSNGRRRKQVQTSSEKIPDLEEARDLPGKMAHGPECMAAIVGYREDPMLFARALSSYKEAVGCQFVLVGVDGDDVPDMEMVRVFQQVNQCPYGISDL